jgi:hypothetical protein
VSGQRLTAVHGSVCLGSSSRFFVPARLQLADCILNSVFLSFLMKGQRARRFHQKKKDCTMLLVQLTLRKQRELHNHSKPMPYQSSLSGMITTVCHQEFTRTGTRSITEVLVTTNCNCRIDQWKSEATGHMLFRIQFPYKFRRYEIQLTIFHANRLPI